VTALETPVGHHLRGELADVAGQPTLFSGSWPQAAHQTCATARPLNHPFFSLVFSIDATDLAYRLYTFIQPPSTVKSAAVT
jgi:hypothetical protein